MGKESSTEDMRAVAKGVQNTEAVKLAENKYPHLIGVVLLALPELVDRILHDNAEMGKYIGPELQRILDLTPQKKYSFDNPDYAAIQAAIKCIPVAFQDLGILDMQAVAKDVKRCKTLREDELVYLLAHVEECPGVAAKRVKELNDILSDINRKKNRKSNNSSNRSSQARGRQR